MKTGFRFWIPELPGVPLSIHKRQWVAHVMEPYPMAPGRTRERRVNVGGTADGEPDPKLVALLAHQLFTAEHDACHVCAVQQKAVRSAGEAHLPPDVPDIPAKSLPTPAKGKTLPLPTPPPRLEEVKHVEKAHSSKASKRSDPQTSSHLNAKAAKQPREKPAAKEKQPPPRRRKPDLVEVAATCPPGDPACSLGVMGGVCAVPAPLFVPSTSGPPEKQVARYCLIDAEKIIPSHIPWKRFRPHPDFPPGVQERRYDRDQAEQLKVIGVAQQLNPEIIFTPAVDAIQGPPVITEDGLVLGGNGRSMALQLHYLADEKASERARGNRPAAAGLTWSWMVRRRCLWPTRRCSSTGGARARRCVRRGGSARG